jgi:hypothetical protein
MIDAVIAPRLIRGPDAVSAEATALADPLLRMRASSASAVPKANGRFARLACGSGCPRIH